MQLIVEGTENARRIISVTNDAGDYILGPGQTVRTIDNSMWGGLRKSEIHWDETKQAVIEAPYPESAEEIEAERIEVVNQKIAKGLPDMLRQQLSYDNMLAEAKQIDDNSKVVK